MTNLALNGVLAVARDERGTLAVVSPRPGSTVYRDHIVRALDPSGAERWAWKGDLRPWDVAALPGGGFLVAGDASRRFRGRTGSEEHTWGGELLAVEEDGKVRWYTVEEHGDRRHEDVLSYRRVVAGRAGGIAVLAYWPGPQIPAIVRYDDIGKRLWEREFGDKERIRLLDVAVDHSGAVLLAGSFSRVVDLGGGPLEPLHLPDEEPPIEYRWTAFVAKYDASGKFLWSRRFGRARDVRVAVAPGGEIVNVVAMRSRKPIDFGGGPLAPPAREDPYPHGGAAIGVLDSEGRHLWSARLPTGEVGSSEMNTIGGVSGVGVDAGGAITIAGAGADAVDLGAGPAVGAGSPSRYLARFTLDRRPLAGARFDVPILLQGVSPQGVAVVSGELAGPVDLGCGPLQPGIDTRTFVAVLAPTIAP